MMDTLYGTVPSPPYVGLKCLLMSVEVFNNEHISLVHSPPEALSLRYPYFPDMTVLKLPTSPYSEHPLP